MAPENQNRIKAIADRYAPGEVVVVLGSASPDALEVAAETVTLGDPSYAGPLAGVSLGLPVVHILEDDIKNQVEARVYEREIGLVELSVDAGAIKVAMTKIRQAAE